MLPAIHREVYEQVLEDGGGGIVVVITMLEGPEKGVPKEEPSSAIGMVLSIYSILRSYR